MCSHSQPILEYLQQLDMQIGDSISLNQFVEYSMTESIAIDLVQDALIHASANGWIVIVDQHIHLTKAGYFITHLANDNRI